MYVILLIFSSLVYNIPAFAHSTYKTYKCNKGWITFCRCISRLIATCGNFFPYMLQNGTRNLRNQHTYMYCVKWFIHLVIFSGPIRTWCGVSHCVEDRVAISRCLFLVSSVRRWNGVSLTFIPYPFFFICTCSIPSNKKCLKQWIRWQCSFSTVTADLKYSRSLHLQWYFLSLRHLSHGIETLLAYP
jgi:hypothetical protein